MTVFLKQSNDIYSHFKTAMDKFYAGWSQPNNGRSGTQHFERCLVSINRLEQRRSNFKVKNWILDSGAFTRLKNKGHLPTANYAKQAYRWLDNGNLEAIVTQDYPCNLGILSGLNLSVAQAQKKTIENYWALIEWLKKYWIQDWIDTERCYIQWGLDIEEEIEFDEAEIEEITTDHLLATSSPSFYVMPVLQGDRPTDYVSHANQYIKSGLEIKQHCWIGVGNLVGRSPQEIGQILEQIKFQFPRFQLHGFGVKKQVFQQCPEVWDLLYSADSQAYYRSTENRQYSRNDPQLAIAYAKSIRPGKEGFLQLSVFSQLQ